MANRTPKSEGREGQLTDPSQRITFGPFIPPPDYEVVRLRHLPKAARTAPTLRAGKEKAR
jgi:hypothetical protein